MQTVNRERGEYLLVARSRSYVLRLTVDACCRLESLTGRWLSDIIAGVNAGKASDARALFWGALQAWHGDAIQSLRCAGLVIDECGGIERGLVQLSAFMAINQDESKASADRKSDREAQKLEPGERWRRLYIDARKGGIASETFWGLSLRELWRELAALTEAREAEWKGQRELAWNTAALANAGFAGKMPSLASFVGRKAPAQTVEQMRAALAMLKAMYPNSRHKSRRELNGSRGRGTEKR